MNELQTFSNELFGEIRTVTENGRILFCGSDVAKALGYKRARDAVRTHCPHAVKYGIGVQTGISTDGSPIMQEVDTAFIPEGDIYRLIIRSKLPSAEKFEKWVFDDILPTIRKHGMYATDELLANPDFAIATFQALKDEREKNKRLEAQIYEQRPLVDFAHTVQSTNDNILIRECSKLASNYIGIDIGEKGLYQKLRDWRMLLKSRNEPTRLAYKQGVLEYVERTIYRRGMPTLAHTTKVTPKGQIYIINRLIREYRDMAV